MAQQFYTVASPGTAIVTNKCLLGIFNGVGSGKIVRVYRTILLNNQTTAITGIALKLNINLLSTGSGGILLNPVKHDSQHLAIPAQVVTSTNMTYTTSQIYRIVPWSTDEPNSQGVHSIDELQLLNSLNDMTNHWWSFNNTTIQPIVLREGQGLGIINTTVTAVGVVDCFIEFSVE